MINMRQDIIHREGQWPINPKTGKPVETDSQSKRVEWSVIGEKVKELDRRAEDLERRKKFIQEMADALEKEAEEEAPNLSVSKIIDLSRKARDEYRAANEEISRIVEEYRYLIGQESTYRRILESYNPEKPDA